MIITTHDTENIIEITIHDTLKEKDFKKLEKEVDKTIKKHGNIRVLVNASDFNGWENVNTAEQHFSFVKNHHNKIEKLAVVTGHVWQHWIATMIRVFIHPKIKVFDEGQLEKARAWLA